MMVIRDQIWSLSSVRLVDQAMECMRQGLAASCWVMPIHCVVEYLPLGDHMRGRLPMVMPWCLEGLLLGRMLAAA